MASGKKKKSKQNRYKRGRSARKNIRRGGMKRQSNPQASSGGGLLVKGIRTLVSYLPGGSIFAKIADFGLKAFGISENGQVVNGKFSGDVFFTGLGGKVLIKYTNIVIGSKAGVRAVSTFKDDSLRNQLLLDFKEARLISLLISVRPIGQQSGRSGEWTLSFAPFYSNEDEALWKSDVGIPDDVSIRRMSYSVTTAASQPLAIRYRPRPSDGFVYQFHPLDTLFGCICVRFNDPGRNSHAEFTPAEFSMDCVITGIVELRQPPTSTAGYLGFSDDPVDVLKSTFSTIQVLNSGANKHHIAKGAKCTASGDLKYCKVQGDVISQFDELNLRDMELS